MAAIRPRPGVFRRTGLRPGPAQQLAPIDTSLLRSFKVPLKTRWHFTGELGDRLSLFHGDLPLARLLGNILPICRLRLRRIENLPAPTCPYRPARLLPLSPALSPLP